MADNKINDAINLVDSFGNETTIDQIGFTNTLAGISVQWSQIQTLENVTSSFRPNTGAPNKLIINDTLEANDDYTAPLIISQLSAVPLGDAKLVLKKDTGGAVFEEVDLTQDSVSYTTPSNITTTATWSDIIDLPANLVAVQPPPNSSTLKVNQTLLLDAGGNQTNTSSVGGLLLQNNSPNPNTYIIDIDNAYALGVPTISLQDNFSGISSVWDTTSLTFNATNQISINPSTGFTITDGTTYTGSYNKNIIDLLYNGGDTELYMTNDPANFRIELLDGINSVSSKITPSSYILSDGVINPSLSFSNNDLTLDSDTGRLLLNAGDNEFYIGQYSASTAPCIVSSGNSGMTLNLNSRSGVATMGDCDNAFNQTTIIVDDANTTISFDAPTIDFLNTSTTTSTSTHTANIKSTSSGLETTTFLKLKLNGTDIWIPYFTTDPSL